MCVRARACVCVCLCVKRACVKRACAAARLRLHEPHVLPLRHGHEVSRVLGAALRDELAQRQGPWVLPCLAAAEEYAHRAEGLHLG